MKYGFTRFGFDFALTSRIPYKYSDWVHSAASFYVLHKDYKINRPNFGRRDIPHDLMAKARYPQTPEAEKKASIAKALAYRIELEEPAREWESNNTDMKAASHDTCAVLLFGQCAPPDFLRMPAV